MKMNDADDIDVDNDDNDFDSDMDVLTYWYFTRYGKATWLKAN